MNAAQSSEPPGNMFPFEKIIDILTNLVKLLEDDFRITSIVIDSLILSSNPYAEDVKIEVRDL